MLRKNKFAVLLFLLFSIYIVILIISKRSLFFTTYNVEYWKDRYEHSQYAMPLSERKIGDDGLHAYAGYRIIKGDDPFSINNDKPPAGKYLLGISIVLFKNPLIIPFLIGIASVFLFFGILKFFVKDKILIGLTSLLFFLDPLYSGQLFIAGLDLMQLFFYLISLYAILVFTNSKSQRYKFWLIILSGVSLGIFAEIKPPILLPLALAVNILLLIKSGLRTLLLYGLSFGFGVVLPYFPYLLMGNTILDIIRVHKFVGSIYLASHVNGNVIAPWTTMIIGSAPRVVGGEMIKISEWTPIWAILLLNSFGFFIVSFYKKHIDMKSIALLLWIFGIFGMYMYVPFYARYLVVIIPFLYIMLGKSFSFFPRKVAYVILIGLILISTIKFYLVLRPDFSNTIENVRHSYSRHYFQDIYEEVLAEDFKAKIQKEEFEYEIRKFLYDTDIVRSSIDEISRKRNKDGYEVEVAITHYNLVLGPIVQNKSLFFRKENGVWRMVWDWDIVADGFVPGSMVEKKYEFGKRGRISDSQKKIRAYDTEQGIMIWVNPDLIDNKREQEMLKLISENFMLSAVGIQNAYIENPLHGEYMPIGTPVRPVDEKVIIKLSTYPGVKITTFPNRMHFDYSSESLKNAFFSECCTRLYSASMYIGANGPEKEFNEMLLGLNGGTVIFNNENGSYIFAEKIKKDGQDIVMQ